MKKILGLDLGTNSIGWAMVGEERDENNKLIDADIIKLGVRVNPLTTDELTDFEKGKPLSTNAERTLKRGARRNLQRYKLRRENLMELLAAANIIKAGIPLTEVGSQSTHQTLQLRAKAARHPIELNELARVLLAINKKRGYKSSRKAQSEDEGMAVDGMAVAKHLYDNQLTPGQYVLELLLKGKKYIPDFYRSDLKAEFDIIWEVQKAFHPEILDDELYKALKDQGQQNTRKRFLAIKGIYTAENKGKREQVKLQAYQWRTDAIQKRVPIAAVAYVLTEINNDTNKSSGYLGKISDRSKILYSDGLTVGEYLYNQIKSNPHTSLKNQVFYRQDYLDEFEQIWETQAKYHPELTPALKEQIRDVVIFYQRKLKSQKGLISHCVFESWEEVRTDKAGNTVYNKSTHQPKMRTVGHRVIPKSSPLFQEFKIWSVLNNLEIKSLKDSNKADLLTEPTTIFEIDESQRDLLFEELNLRGKLTEKQILNLLGISAKEFKTNYPEGLEGNRTNAALFNIYQTIAENEGYGHDWEKKSASEITTELKAIFPEMGIEAGILDFDSNLEGNDFDKQPAYQLWHLLYSVTDDDKVSEEDKITYGNNATALKKKLHLKFGFKPEYTKLLAAITLSDDYGNLSARAIRKIMPFLQNGNRYDEACKLAGYNHSNSLTKEENEKRALKDKLEVLAKNSLRNPVVEKILNQMVNVVNQVIDEYGKPDEIRVELARDLKKSAKERAEDIKFIADNTKANDEVRQIIQKDFGFTPTRNDVIRYKLWLELGKNGYKDIFTNQQIKREQIFSKEIDIEHIIPKALLFDDSFSNKTLAFRQVNLKKSNRTAVDFISDEYGDEGLAQFTARVESLFKNNAITKGKYKKLLMTQDKLPDGFIERDLRNSQYIAKKATAMLQELVRPKVVATTGKITDRLRSDWDLINVMKELNLPKYRELGLTKMQTRRDNGQEQEKEVEIIEGWTKRNDHRHHAMDALTVAFTHHNHIQYINNLNARKNEFHKKHSNIIAIEKVITATKNNKRYFIPPMPNFRQEAQKHIEGILISFKTKNKVVTKNINKIKKKKGYTDKTQLTPRGQLHKETIYGKSKRPMDKPTKLSKRFTMQQAQLIIDAEQRKLVLAHMAQFGNNPEIALDTKTLKKQPITWKDEPLKAVLCFEEIFTIRKDISPDLTVDKVVDDKVRAILQQRIKDYGNAKAAFSDIAKDPIWLNKDKGISIKRVTITGVSNAEALHTKKDHLGNEILDTNGKPIPVDYVSTGNNHHVAIYRDADGKLQEQVVSFYEAVARVQQDLPIIDKAYNTDLGWEFLFTMKQNEMFIFPSEKDNFNPAHIDLMDVHNAALISKHLFRVQKIATKNYFFRHHLETTVENHKELNGIAYKSQLGLSAIEGIIKVRLNHLGKIVQIGEY
ncbi:type II CRISPR RNA-guided endonuclease Cas9 [Ostreibacterium oceani]|uniref:CRISPR-associated endonuclease Cas9 n=1 Tax=Ostreibacterium oceani TaxID=2654998 RepID=A0A6N7EV88_9GAMM|nr:type II CRISPR RNA-guided endonuclease Cas9 [Ostreibacterium oceani]MPV85450.1 type II CRISPR RNA-guided endonuclease Cas9 [Ostreibacterium oceani]